MHLVTAAGQLLDRRAASAGAGPLLTCYDDRVGERVELSATTTQNWVNKATNLLLDELGLDPGDPVRLPAQAHWHTAVLALACWRAELVTCFDAAATTARALDWQELAGELAAQPDLVGAPPPSGTAPALRAERWQASQDELTARVGELGYPRGARLHETGSDWSDPDRLLAAVLGPLVCGGSLVQSHPVAGTDLTAREAMERVTLRL